MRREKRHQTALNKLVRNEALHPSRRLLAELLSMMFDCEGPEREKLLTVLVEQYGRPGAVKWGDGIEDKRTMPDGADKESIPAIKGYFEQAVSGENAISTEIVHTIDDE